MGQVNTRGINNVLQSRDDSKLRLGVNSYIISELTDNVTVEYTYAISFHLNPLYFEQFDNITKKKLLFS